jgi:hypothetical protein
MPVADPSLIREEPTPQPASPLPEMEEAEEQGLSMDFAEREEEPRKGSESGASRLDEGRTSG